MVQFICPTDLKAAAWSSTHHKIPVNLMLPRQLIEYRGFDSAQRSPGQCGASESVLGEIRLVPRIVPSSVPRKSSDFGSITGTCKSTAVLAECLGPSTPPRLVTT